MFKKLFGKDDDKDKEKKKEDKKAEAKSSIKKKEHHSSERRKEQSGSGKRKESGKDKNHSSAASGGNAAKPKRAQGTAPGGKSRRRRKKKDNSKTVVVDVSKPLDWPTIPETIIEYHKQKPFLTQNEEWLIVELNEFECMIESREIIKIIAKHSKFFDVEPPELLDEFFEWVEEAPSYDEIINYDIWQEFRDDKYAM